MFDVSWTDPSRETVGQRKSRKDQQPGSISGESSVHSSGSSDSRISTSPPPSRPSIFGLFSGKKTGLLHTGSHSKSSALRGSDVNVPRRISSYNANHVPMTLPVDTAPSRVNVKPSGTGRISYTTDTNSPHGWTERSANTDSSWRSMVDPGVGKVQPLSRTSFVTQSTEITVSSCDSVKAAEQLATLVHISAAGTMPVKISDSPTTLSPSSEVFEFPVSASQLNESQPAKVVALQAPGWPVAMNRRGADTWRAPEAWDCSPKEPPPATKSPRIGISRLKRQKRMLQSAELKHLEKNIRRMEAASPKIVLERLKEEWVGVMDASVYRELELEKQLWVLSALKSLTKRSSETVGGYSPVDNTSPSVPSKVLSLYENHASASFLAATSLHHDIHHLSSKPLSPKAYSNVYPLTIPGPSHHFPYASNIFTAIHAFSLPTLLPSSSLPSVLKECNRTLSSSGTLHLTILDPSPLPSTLGPRLRGWLDAHLLVNLERHFRCMNPSRLLPIWLSDAGLRAHGSTIINTRFLASVSSTAQVPSPCVIVHPGDPVDLSCDTDSFIGSATGDEDSETRQKLKSHVGRMLWKEMWGSFVEGNMWWWEDERLLEECERMGTEWEYAIIQAVKEQTSPSALTMTET